MAFLKQIEPGAGIVGIWKLEESSEILAKNFRFTEREKREFAKIKIEKRKREYLAVRKLVEQLLSVKCEIFYGNQGNPQIKNHKSYLSVSHSAQLLTVFISSEKVGIDTEVTSRDTEKIKSRFLSENELDQTEKSGDPKLTRIVYWSAKEAIFKCALKSNIEFKSQIEIQPFQLQQKGEFYGTMKTEKITKNFRLQYILLENNIIVYCVED